MKRITKALALMLALIMMVGLLAGCGEKTPTEEVPEFVYVPTYAELDLGLEYVNSACAAGGRIYFAGQITEEVEPEPGVGAETGTPVADSLTAEAMPTVEGPGMYPQMVRRMVLLSCAEDGSDVKQLENYAPKEIPEGMQGEANINRICADKDGNLWVSENLYTYWYDLPAGVEPDSEAAWDYYQSKEEYFVRKLDPTGKELSSIDLSFMQSEEQEYFYLSAFDCDGNGNLYLGDSEGAIYVLDGNAAQLFKLELDNGWINSLIPLADGTMAANFYEDSAEGSKQVLKRIDIAKKGWGEAAPDCPANAYNFYAGSGDYDFYYNNQTSFFGFDMETGVSERLITWINSDVDANNINIIVPTADGRILCVTTDWSDKGSEQTNELITMTKTPYTPSDKTVLTYACMYLDYNIRSQIIDFNKTSDKYRIEVRDYSEYNTGEDYNAGVTKLNTEIIAGQVPDIIAVSSLPISQYGAKGLLEDLWPLIEADTALGGRSALVEPLFSALENDGKLYQVVPSFNVQTTYALADVVGTEMGWTVADLNAAMEKLKEDATVFGVGMTKADMLSYVYSMYMDDLVNWETGECSFTSDTFIDLLHLTERFPETFDWEHYDYETDYKDPAISMAEGEQLMNSFYLYSLDDIYYTLGNDLSKYTFVGFPTADGSVGSAFSVDSGLAMSSKCKDKEGAWQFIRTFLTEDYQRENVWNMPSNNKLLQEKLKEAMTPEYYTDENGNQVEIPKGTYYASGSDEPIEVFAMDQATADKLLAIISSTTRTTSYDQSLYEIISDECKSFFTGDKSAEETAEMIQSRVSLYVNEQR